MESPIIVGGNGHSGTLLFAEILMECGISMGFPNYSYDRKSKDLNIRYLMTRWMKPYLLGQDETQNAKMQRAFRRRLRLLIPFRGKPWGFKNPRAMFLLPFYRDMFPNMKFIHVIRDGRDMCFGNPFIHSPTYWSFVSEEEAARLTLEERMMRFWGESNKRVKEYGESHLGSRYLLVRFEDICDNTAEQMRLILEFANGPVDRLDDFIPMVKRPKSIGRWKSFDTTETDKVVKLGQDYLAEFGYI